MQLVGRGDQFEGEVQVQLQAAFWEGRRVEDVIMRRIVLEQNRW